MLLSEDAAARPFHLGPARAAFEPTDVFHLDAGVEADDPAAPVAAKAPLPPAPPKLFDKKTTLFSVGVLVTVPVLGYLTWWHSDWTGHFAFANERWFQEDTFAGGADKASHITFSYMFTLAFQSAYRSLGKTPAEARALAFGLTVLSGLVVEVGDGMSRYGFSWEDAAANTIGAGIATLVDAYGLKDAIGLRFGWVPNSIPPPCCRYAGFGNDYSGEIYTADLKLEGFLPRVGVTPGLFRFLLVGMTYGSKGYRHSPPEYRQRQLGFEIGLAIPPILRAVGVRDEKWWEKALIVFFEYFRVPYTAFGWQVDLNHGHWYGPNTGGTYDPGYILYD
ncbi:MAG: DUF2279 domain-containing protein [Thermoanaerobaculia bacterium]